MSRHKFLPIILLYPLDNHNPKLLTLLFVVFLHASYDLSQDTAEQIVTDTNIITDNKNNPLMF